jgi:hypothetical protein
MTTQEVATILAIIFTITSGIFFAWGLKKGK